MSRVTWSSKISLERYVHNSEHGSRLKLAAMGLGGGTIWRGCRGCDRRAGYAPLNYPTLHRFQIFLPSFRDLKPEELRGGPPPDPVLSLLGYLQDLHILQILLVDIDRLGSPCRRPVEIDVGMLVSHGQRHLEDEGVAAAHLGDDDRDLGEPLRQDVREQGHAVVERGRELRPSRQKHNGHAVAGQDLHERPQFFRNTLRRGLAGETSRQNLSAAYQPQVLDIVLDLLARLGPIDLLQDLALGRVPGMLVTDIEQTDEMLRMLFHCGRDQHRVLRKSGLNESFIDTSRLHVRDQKVRQILHIHIAGSEDIGSPSPQSYHIASRLNRVAGIEIRIAERMRVEIDNHFFSRTSFTSPISRPSSMTSAYSLSSSRRKP